MIGPGGIYLLNAASARPGCGVVGDRFTVDGREQPYVRRDPRRGRRSADRFSSATRWDVSVTGVIVPINDRRLVIEHFPDDVAVVDQVDVANWLVNRPEQFTSVRSWRVRCSTRAPSGSRSSPSEPIPTRLGGSSACPRSLAHVR